MVGLKAGARGADAFIAAALPAMDLVYNLARRLVPAADVEDLVQETFARAFDAWARGRGPRRMEPWLATICLNTGRSWLRRASARHEIAVEPDPRVASGVDVSGEAIENVRRDAVHRALWALPEEQRIAIALMDLCGLTASEAAAVTASPRATVLTRVHRGRKRLARILEEEVSRIEA